jgi:hypothetical protein
MDQILIDTRVLLLFFFFFFFFFVCVFFWGGHARTGVVWLFCYYVNLSLAAAAKFFKKKRIMVGQKFRIEWAKLMAQFLRIYSLK